MDHRIPVSVAFPWTVIAVAFLIWFWWAIRDVADDVTRYIPRLGLTAIAAFWGGYYLDRDRFGIYAFGAALAVWEITRHVKWNQQG